MVDHSAQMPEVVRDSGIEFVRHPIIAEVFTSGTGWKTYSIKKRISRSWVRNHLVPDGITHIQLTDATGRGRPGHYADFSVLELLQVNTKGSSRNCGSGVPD